MICHPGNFDVDFAGPSRDAVTAIETLDPSRKIIWRIARPTERATVARRLEREAATRAFKSETVQIYDSTDWKHPSSGPQIERAACVWS